MVGRSALPARSQRPGPPGDFAAVYLWRRRLVWLLDDFAAMRRPLVLVGALVVVVLMGLADYFTGPVLSFALFYLLPVAFAAWVLGRRQGLVVAAAAVVAWLTADLLDPLSLVTSPVHYWNGAVFFGFLVVVVVLLTALRSALDYENQLLAEVQRQLLPEVGPAIPGASLAVHWRPAGVVGGDYYDVLRLDDLATGVCIADVSGKGVRAAIVMSNLQAGVRALATERVPPATLCARLNRAVTDNVRSGTFVTFFFAVLDPERRRLSYCNAGHNYPVLVHADGSHERLSEGGPVLGFFPEAAYRQGELAVASGDRLVLFTDGVTERAGPDGSELGEERLVAALVANRAADAAGLRDAVVEAVEAFGHGPFDDDLTLVVVALT